MASATAFLCFFEENVGKVYNYFTGQANEKVIMNDFIVQVKQKQRAGGLIFVYFVCIIKLTVYADNLPPHPHLFWRKLSEQNK